MRGPRRNSVAGSYVVCDIDCMRQGVSIESTLRGGARIPLIRLESKRLTAEKWESEVPFYTLGFEAMNIGPRSSTH
jgi:hypothetical protein